MVDAYESLRRDRLMYFLAGSAALGTWRRDATNARPEYVTTATSTYFSSISDPTTATAAAAAPTARENSSEIAVIGEDILHDFRPGFPPLLRNVASR